MLLTCCVVGFVVFLWGFFVFGGFFVCVGFFFLVVVEGFLVFFFVFNAPILEKKLYLIQYILGLFIPFCWLLHICI